MRLFLSLLAVFCLLPFALCCIHDQLQYKPRIYPYPTSSDEGRMLAVGDRENMRIKAYYYVGNAPTAVKNVIQQQLMPAVIAYYEAALKVSRATAPIQYSNADAQECAKVDAVDSLKNGINADLVLFITGANEPEKGYVAYASACDIDPTTNRPVVGMINFNYAYGFDKDSFLTYQTQIYTTLHELGHVLGFSSSLYPFFVDPTTNKKLGVANVVKTKTVNGYAGVSVLTLQPLTDRLKTYFNCQELDGAYIEQEGGPGSAGSHFERRIFLNEFMTASDIIDCRVSEFYLALLEGTGWYTPDYSMAEPMFWGKGKGCAFVNSKCVDTTTKQATITDSFCNDLGNIGCTFGAQGYGVCGTNDLTQKDTSMDTAFNYWGDFRKMADSFADNCPYYSFYSGAECRDSSNEPRNLPTGEYFGEESRCFTGTLGVQKALPTTSPMCIKKYCTKVSTNQYNVLLEIAGKNTTCTQEGAISVDGMFGTINCPNPNTFCVSSGLTYCARGCLGRGTCVENKCVCNKGYYGDDCSYRVVVPGEAEPESGPNKTAIGVGAGVGGGALLAIIGFIIAKIKAMQAGGAAGIAGKAAAGNSGAQPGQGADNAV